MKNLSVIVGRTLVAMALVVATPAWGQTGPATPAQALFDSGKKAVEEERLPDALKMFAESYKLDPQPRTAAWLGTAQALTGDYVAAATNFELYLREEKQPPAKMQQKITESLADAKKKVVTVTFELDPAPLEASVDGARIEEKQLSWPLYLAPGEHSFEFKKEGCSPKTVNAKYAAGLPQVVRAKLDCAKSGNGQGNGQQGKLGNGGGVAPEAKIGFVVAGGLAAVAIGTGIGAMVTYGPTRDAYVAKDVQTYEDHRHTLEGLSWTATISSALAVGALAYAVTRPRSEQASNNAPRVGLMVAPTVAGMAISGTW